MEKNQTVSFERNRYYAGKLLTSTDFLAEQDYMNRKRQFLNRFVLGRGVVCGLGVFNLDDFSIMVESGIAIDGAGREIVVGGSVVKKLSAVEGFDEITGERAMLCLRYKEEGIQPVYVPGKQEAGEEYECNRIEEGYQLFLRDTASEQPAWQMETEFYSAGQLYSDSDYTVSVTMPYIVSCGCWVKAVLEVEKLGGQEGDFSLDTVLQMPAFVTEEDGHELTIHTGSIRLENGRRFRKEYWLYSQAEECESTVIIVKDGKVRVTSGDFDIESDSSLNLRVSIQAVSPKELVTREAGKISLEMRQMDSETDFVPLAEFTLVRAEHSYVIERVAEQGVKRYIPLPAEEKLREEYDSFFGGDMLRAAEFGAAEQKDRAGGEIEGKFAEPVYASGTCEIPLGLNARKGLVKYSGEIVHGLGHGDVQVLLGVEYLQKDQALGREVRHTIYGNPGLFAQQEDMAAPLVETAVNVSNDKGCFTAAVMLLKDSEETSVTLRWIAKKLPAADHADELERRSGARIAAEAPTVVLEPGASHYFHILFYGMEPCSLNYQLTEEMSGEITGEGVYTAPKREGIYEIAVNCAEHPEIGTYAYAIVRK